MICSICGKVIAPSTTIVGNGDGSMKRGGQFAHKECWDNRHVKYCSFCGHKTGQTHDPSCDKRYNNGIPSVVT